MISGNKTCGLKTQLEHQRSELAVCIFASQMGLPKRDLEPDGASFVAAGRWTNTADAYVLQGIAAGLSDSKIQELYFPNTRSVGAIQKKRCGLQNQQQAVVNRQQLSTSATAMPPGQVLQSNRILPLNETIRAVYTHMIIHNSDISEEKTERILSLIDHLGWPSNVQARGEIGTGPLEGFQSGWSDADNRLLMALRSEFQLEWKDVANVFFVDRLEEELEKQYEILQAGGDANNSIELT